MPDDEFASSSNGYSPSKFYTHSADPGTLGLGSATLRLRVPKVSMNAWRAFVAKGLVPEFRTVEDVVRNSLFHGTKLIEDTINDISFSEALRVFQQDMILDDMRARQIQREKTLKNAEDLLRNAVGPTEVASARAVVLGRAEVEPDQHAKGRLMDLVERYGR
jgi:hypothetical protein